MCEKITENDKIALYLDEENERLCLYVKASGKYWWTSPINVQADQTIIDTVRAELDLCKHLSVYLRSVLLLDLI